MRFVKLFALVSTLLFSGCLTHYIVEGSCRLQIGNDTERYTVESFSVVTENAEIPWIKGDILPGEKSRVVEEDLVGTFKVRLRMSGAAAVDTVFEQRFDAGSVFLQIREKTGTIEIVTR